MTIPGKFKKAKKITTGKIDIKLVPAAFELECA